MTDYILPQDEIIELKTAHRSAIKMHSYMADRIHVIILLGMGMSLLEVIEILFLDEATIISY